MDHLALRMNTIRPSQLACFVIVLFIACSPRQEQATAPPLSEAEQIVRASITAHGGLERWQTLETISYKKTITLYDAGGEVESHTVQQHDYLLQPQLTGSISWLSGEDRIKVTYQDGQAIRSKNGAADTTITTEASKNAFMAGYHVLFQPFQLLEDGVDLEYLGDQSLADGIKVHVIQPTYDRSNGDTWWYYFNVETKRFEGYLVFHVDHHAYITNLSFDDNSPMMLIHERKSFRSDQDRNIEYLRAEYLYENFEMTFTESS